MSPPSKKSQSLQQYLARSTGRWLVPLALMALSLMGLSAFVTYRERLHALDTLAVGLSRQVDSYLTRRLHGLQASEAVINDGLIADTLPAWYSLLRAYDRAFDSPTSMVSGADTLMLHTRRPLSGPLPSTVNPEVAKVVRQARLSSKPQVSALVMGQVMAEPVVAIVYPLSKSDGRLLLATVRTDRLQGILLRQKLPEGVSVTIVDQASTVIARSHNPLGAEMSDSGDGFRTGAGVLTAPWSVVVKADSAVFLRPLLFAASGIAAWVLITFVGAALTARSGSRALVHAVRRLIRQEQDSIDEGSSSKRFPRITEFESIHGELRRAATAERNAQEAERERIARELHDGLQQETVAARIRLDLALTEIEPGSRPSTSIQEALGSLERISREIEQIVQDLRPRSLEMLGFLHAARHLALETEKLAGTKIEFELIGDEAVADLLPKHVADNLFRLLQEALNNVRKHAKASFVHVAVDVSRDDQVSLAVSDDGVGVPDGVGGVGAGFGIDSMRRRVDALNGTFRIAKGHNGDAYRGTTVRIVIPLRQEVAA